MWQHSNTPTYLYTCTACECCSLYKHTLETTPPPTALLPLLGRPHGDIIHAWCKISLGGHLDVLGLRHWVNASGSFCPLFLFSILFVISFCTFWMFQKLPYSQHFLHLSLFILFLEMAKLSWNARGPFFFLFFSLRLRLHARLKSG